MPCCGSQRMQAILGAPARPLPDRGVGPVRSTAVYLQYLGTTTLTAVGAATGTRYHFDSPGDIVAVDTRDQPWLRAIPHLRQVHLP